MDAVEFLTNQHRGLEHYFEEALTAATVDEKQRLCRLIADHIASHIAIEEQLFYPAVHVRWTEYDLLLSLEEHLSLKRLLADLLALEGEDATFHPKLKVLCDQAVHHHCKEEEYLFPKVKEVLSEEEREALGREMRLMQDEMLRKDESCEAVIRQTDAAAPLE